MKVKTIIIVLLLSVALAQAQDECTARISAQIANAGLTCANVELAALCYGSGAQSIESDIEVEYQEPGSSVDLGEIRTLTISSREEAFGLAVLRPRLNLADSGVLMLAFGDVQIANLSEQSSDFVTFDVTVRDRSGTNVRAEPREDTAISDVWEWGREALAIGRSVDGAWVLAAADNARGWIPAQRLDADYDWMLLRVAAVDEALTPPYSTAMQAFSLITGVNDAPCAGTPDSGVLLQTPEVDIEAEMIIFDREITFNGTLLVQSTFEESVGGELRLSVLEGSARFALIEETRTLNVGERARIRINSNGMYTGDPIEIDDYHYSRARYLPLALLTRQIELPFSLGGLLTPYAQGGLAQVAADAPCTVAWLSPVNVRFGPGTQYPIRQGVEGGFSARPDARATGLDGALWWRLAEDIWLAADATAAGGMCGTLPLVEPPPLPSR